MESNNDTRKKDVAVLETIKNNRPEVKSLWRNLSAEVLFFSLIAGMSVVGGFGMTITLAKRRDPNYFTKGLIAGHNIPESGGALALRALGKASLYAAGGFTLFCCIVWKISGVQSMADLREKVQRQLPSIPKHEPRGRSDFKTLRELVNYLIEEDERKKRDEK